MALGIEAKNPNAGLILSYEKTGYDVNTPGRLPEILPNESLQRLVKKGQMLRKSWFIIIQMNRKRF